MIKSSTNGEWKEPGSLCQAVGIYKEDFHKIVSVVGGGGKTTVIRAMLRECMENSDGRIPCAVSTTTHIQKTNAEYFLGEPSMKMFRKKLSDYEAVWMGREIRKGKLASFQKEFLEEVSREPVLLLLEADGAKHFPVKAPAEHEPVICEKTGIVLNVYGMRAIGKKIKDVCFRIADTEEEKQTAMQLAEDIGKKLSEKYISEKNTKDTEFSRQISKVHVTSDLIPLEERW